MSESMTSQKNQLQQQIQTLEVKIREAQSEVQSRSYSGGSYGGSGSSGGGCFAGDSQVLIRGKGLTNLKDLRVGDDVETGFGWARVATFLHWHPLDMVAAITIMLPTSNLTVSREHLLFKTTPGEGGARPVRAADVKRGECPQNVTDLNA